jgi:signal transduction histidine kinase
MRLQWKYALIINLSVLTILMAFYVIDDIKARNDLRQLHIQNIENGAIFRKVADIIRQNIEYTIGLDYKFNPRRVENTLRLIKQESLEMRNVIDINVTIKDARIRASLKPGKSKDDYINFTYSDRDKVERDGVQVYNLVELERGKYATEIILPYQFSVIDRPAITGFIQVLFEAPDITRRINELRRLRLIFVIIVSVLLNIIIIITTTRLVMRPLERMMEIIKHAEADDLESLPQSYSSGEIGRVTSSLVRMLRQLKQSHSKRIAALEQFAGGVAHEIRNPLNTIGMTAQHLKSIFSQEQIEPEDIEEAREFLDIVDIEIRRLRGLTEQFLTLNRPKKLNLEPTDLNKLLDQVLAEFTLLMENANVRAVKNYEQTLPAFQLDVDLIRQVIFNLVQNSIQAMPKGGRIYITTQFGQTKSGAAVILEIRDTGVGIPDELQERIYDAYFTTKENEGGIGLGLAVSHQIIKAHQGEVDLQSKVGMGTAFKITLPIQQRS